MKKFVFLPFIFFLFGCNTDKTKTNIINMNDLNQDGRIIIRSWQVLGPFPSAGKSSCLDNDDLESFGYMESSISYNDFVNISADKKKSGIVLSEKFINTLINSESPCIDINEIFGYAPDSSINGNAYLACTIESNKDTSVRLDFSSDDGAKVWLNNQQLLRIEKNRALVDYENYLLLKLKKGSNFLLTKVYNSMGDWKMYAKLENDSKESLNRYYTILKLLTNHNFFMQSILDTSSCLIFSDRLPKANYPLSIADRNNKIAFQEIFNTNEKSKIDCSALKEGEYYASIIVNEDTYEQVIYKGDIIHKIKKIISKIERYKTSDKVTSCLNANIFRFNHLLKPESRGRSLSENQYWQRKLISLDMEFTSILYNLEHKKIEPLKGIPGTHLRTYVSEIDNKLQYYIAHIPKSYSDKSPSQLVVFLPTSVLNHQPYLESMRVANFKLIENLQEMSDKYNMIVLETFSREVGRPNFNSIEETDMFEALNSLKEDYRIDTSRIFLTSTCIGANKVLQVAERYPQMFTALGMVSPTFLSSFSTILWSTQMEVLKYVNNIKNLPVVVVHSVLDAHSSIQNSENFINKARVEGITDINYIRLPDVIDPFYWNQYADTIFTFFKNHNVRKNPLSVSFSTNQLKYNNAYWVKNITFNSMSIARVDAQVDTINNTYSVTASNVIGYTLDLPSSKITLHKPVKVIENGRIVFNEVPKNNFITIKEVNKQSENNICKNSQIEGPLTHIFIHKFMIVIGTKGSADENLKIRQMADSINEAWLYKYYNTCLIKYDYEITNDDIRNSNLLLLGNYNSNNILTRLKNVLPLNIYGDSIKIGNKVAQGKTLGCYMVYPNPLNKNKYVAVISYNNPSYISIGNTDMEPERFAKLMDKMKFDYYYDISSYGWYDYKIWDAITSKNIISGYFDYYWN
ncbi:MAG: hypothetical protein ABR936_04465 [Bacteroidota bacterium]|jgi:hypothetical protein